MILILESDSIIHVLFRFVKPFLQKNDRNFSVAQVADKIRIFFSAPSVRDGVRDAMRLAEFSHRENILRREATGGVLQRARLLPSAIADTSLTEGGKKLDCARMRAANGRPYGLAKFCANLYGCGGSKPPPYGV